MNTLTCALCLQPFNLLDRVPRILPNCGHTLCNHCLAKTLETSQPKCPVEQTDLSLTNLEDFPLNFLAKQLLEANVGWELCEVHDCKKEVVCLTDQCKVCVHCALFNGHRDHQLKHIMEIRNEFDLQKADLEAGLINLDNYSKEIETILEEKKQTMQKMVEDRYEELTFLLRMKKLGLLFELDSIFTKNKTKLIYSIGNDSPLRANILTKINNYKENPKDEDLFRMLEENLLDFNAKLDRVLLKSQAQELRQKLNDAVTVFGDSLFAQLDSLTKLEFQVQPQYKAKPEENSNEEISEDVSTNLNASASCVKLESTLEFETCNGYLEINTTSYTPRNIIMDTEEWKKMKEVRFKLDKALLLEEDIKTLEHIWSKLEQVRRIRIDASFQKNITDEHLLPMFSIIFGKLQTVCEIEINFEESLVEDDSIIHVSEKVLTNAPSLKVFSLNLNATNVTNKAIQALAESGLSSMKTLESFIFYCGNTQVSEECLTQVLTSLPNISHFELGLSCSNIGDRGLKAFTDKSLPSMTSLKKLKMRLWKTQVTDESVAHLFASMPDLKAFTFDLGSNTLTDQSVQILIDSKLAEMKTLKNFKLYLYDTKISEQTVAKLYHIKNKLQAN